MFSRFSRLATRLNASGLRRSARLAATCALAVLAVSAAPASGALFASSVSSYAPGTGIAAGYQNPDVARGRPAAFTGEGDFVYAHTPFNAAYAGSDLVGIGPGGSLTLQFAQPIPTGPGREFGVHAGINLTDVSYPNGQNGATATTFNQRSANVSVSDGVGGFVDLGAVTFDLPTNYYDQGITTPGAQTTQGMREADFGRPFAGPLSAFNGKDWQETLAVLNGSAGGTWIDVTPAQLSEVLLVRFTVGTGQLMYVDAVSAPIPEPAGVAAAAFAIGTLAHRRRRRT